MHTLRVYASKRNEVYQFAMDSRINDKVKMQQLIDFQGCTLGEGIYPTDIDAIIEYRNSEYIIIESKFRDSPIPKGQRIALMRMVDDFTTAGKKAVLLVVTHHVKDPNEVIDLASCRVREIYYGCEKKWRKPERQITTHDAIELVHQFFNGNTQKSF